ncbi:MAG: serine hydrolase domain-containing protein [Bacteroidota bacterium]
MNRINHSLIVLFIGVLIHSHWVVGQIPTYDTTLIETLAHEFLNTTHLPGFSLAAGKGGKILYARGFGFADREREVPMTPSTRLRTASVAKVLTATAIAKLVSEGKLKLDSPIKTYVPYIPARYADLTCRQLAGHTAGIPHRPKGNGYQKKPFTSIQKTVELFRSSLRFTPDTEYQYSTGGFNLLAAAIEGASGGEYKDYMEKEIFEPLGMYNTQPEDINALSENDAQLYSIKDQVLKREKKLVNGSYKLPGAGFRSTPSDLVKMMEAYSGEMISPEVTQAIFTSHTLKNGEKTQVGIGWRTSIDAFGKICIEHAGSWQGARSVIVFYPEEELSVSIMINASCQVFIEEMAHIFAQLFRHDFNRVEAPQSSASNQAVNIIFRSSEGEQKLLGEISLQGTSGELSSANSKGFLHAIPLHYLGQKDWYAAITPYGIHYMEIRKKPSLSGELFLYGTRNASPPTQDTPMVSFFE